jgi:amidase
MEEWTISEIQSRMQSGELTSHELTRLYLERIETIDKNGPCLNSVIEVNPDALTIAQALDKERKDKSPRSPLHGIPILVKDNIDTADRMTTASGSLALEGTLAAQDAYLVERLRQAGAVILGKANLSEWANFRSSHSISGWSSRGGFTRNPYALDRNPCGSSSGSAVAVAANLCAAAVGTETDGSVICPSQTNGIVGIKPTLGLVSRSGIIPIAHSQDTAGPMARTVADAAILLAAMAGVDPRDPATAAAQEHIIPDYTPFLKADGMKGARIGVARKLFGFDPKVDQLMESCLEAMQRLGAELVDPVKLEEKFSKTEFEVLKYEFKADLNAYLAGLGPHARVHSMKEIIEFNRMPSGSCVLWTERMPGRSQARSPSRLTSKPTDEPSLGGMRHRYDPAAAQAGCNYGSSRGPWLTDLVSDLLRQFSSPAAVTRTSPSAGLIHGLPVGISFFSGAYQEPVLLRLAYAFEQAVAARRPPRFLPTVELG